MNNIESRALELLFQHQLDTGYIYFVDGEPVTNPRQLIEAIEKNRKIISVMVQYQKQLTRILHLSLDYQEISHAPHSSIPGSADNDTISVSEIRE